MTLLIMPMRIRYSGYKGKSRKEVDELIIQLFDRTVNSIKKIKTMNSEKLEYYWLTISIIYIESKD